MKTVSELNTKWWYRLIKVVYIISFLIALGCALVIPPVEYLDPYERIADCNNGKRISNNELNENDIRLNSYNSFISADDSIKIRYLCEPNIKYISKVSMQKILDERPKGTEADKVLEAFVREGWIIEGVNSNPNKTYKEYSTEEFNKISYEVKKDIKWMDMIGVLIASFLGVIVFFEIVRRIFYYVILGSIRPIR